MTFSTAVPDGATTIAGNKPKFLANFTSMNTAFSADHTQFDSGVNVGLHKKISFIGNSPALNPIPITQSGITMICNTSGSNFTLSCVERDGGVTKDRVQLTAKTTPLTDTNGRSFLPGRTAVWNQSMGLLICWGMMPKGDSGTNGNESAEIYFNPAPGHAALFSVPPYSIIITPKRPAGIVDTPEFVSSVAGSLTTTFFKIINTSTAQHDVYWMAIGHEV